MLFAGRAAAQQATTLKLYSAVYEVEAEMLAFQVQESASRRFEPVAGAGRPRSA
jgi:hypothetical protein